MSKWDKLLNKICSLSSDVRFNELKKILESYGYTMYAPSGGSSHYTFRKPGRNPITIAVESRAQVGFCRRLSANTSLPSLAIRQYACGRSPSLDENLLCKNCFAPHTEGF